MSIVNQDQPQFSLEESLSDADDILGKRESYSLQDENIENMVPAH